MSIVMQELSSFIRKRPSKEGALKLAQYALECDLSFAQTLLPAANKYFKEIYCQWNKYQVELE